MGFRTIAITKRAKLNLTMGFLEVRGEETTKIFLDDIDILMIDNQAVSMTAALMTKLMQKKIKVIFCDEKRNPLAELVPYYGSVDSSRKVRMQLLWTEETKESVWTIIVKEKIKKQAEFLEELGKEREAALLYNYIKELANGDATNREGMAAKVYFNAIFGMDFNREENSPINSALDYGYSLVLSTVNKEISYNGYLTQLGLFHNNVFNPFNLTSDLMEPFRILVDRIVYHNGFTEFGTEEKREMLRLFETEVKIDGKRQTFSNAMRIYVRSVVNALSDNNPDEILFYTI